MESLLNFHALAKDIHVKEGYILVDRLYNPLDKWSYYISIDLNYCIGNIDGICAQQLFCSVGLQR